MSGQRKQQTRAFNKEVLVKLLYLKKEVGEDKILFYVNLFHALPLLELRFLLIIMNQTKN